MSALQKKREKNLLLLVLKQSLLFLTDSPESFPSSPYGLLAELYRSVAA